MDFLDLGASSLYLHFRFCYLILERFVWPTTSKEIELFCDMPAYRQTLPMPIKCRYEFSDSLLGGVGVGGSSASIQRPPVIHSNRFLVAENRSFSFFKIRLLSVKYLWNHK